MVREEFPDQYGLVGVKTSELLGSYPQPAIKNIFANRISKPVNPTSLIDGTITNQLNFAGTNLILGHFRQIFKSNDTTFYLSDGTTPNGTLPGNQGDLCFNADSGLTYYCTGTTNWTSM